MITFVLHVLHACVSPSLEASRSSHGLLPETGAAGTETTGGSSSRRDHPELGPPCSRIGALLQRGVVPALGHDTLCTEEEVISVLRYGCMGQQQEEGEEKEEKEATQRNKKAQLSRHRDATAAAAGTIQSTNLSTGSNSNNPHRVRYHITHGT